MNCIFCSINNKESKADIVYEDDEVMAFKDVSPKAPVHLLVIPKKHISTVNDIKKNDIELLGQLIFRAKLLAQEQGISESGYKLVFNCGKDAGQIVDHIHLHLLGGAPLGGIL